MPNRDNQNPRIHSGSINTCKTCKWWKDRDDRQSVYVNAKQCTCPTVVFAESKDATPTDYQQTGEFKYPDQVVIDSEAETPIAATGAGVMDGSGYWAALLTGPEFGCVNHEEGGE